MKISHAKPVSLTYSIFSSTFFIYIYVNKIRDRLLESIFKITSLLLCSELHLSEILAGMKRNMKYQGAMKTFFNTKEYVKCTSSTC